MRSLLGTLFKIRRGEGLLVAYVAALFAFAQAAQGISANAADSLFLVRFGASNLPYLFMALGLASLVATLLYSAGALHIAPRRFLSLLLLGLAAILLVERVALGSDLSPVVPIVWLTVNVINALVGIIIWYVAGEVVDTRQAKRLFPLFASGGIVGGLIGNLSTGVLAQTFGTENLLFAAMLMLIGAWAASVEVIRRFFRGGETKRANASLWQDLRTGLDYVRTSRLMQLIGFSSVLFSILFFSVTFPFSRAVSQAFPDEAALAGFLGLFTAGATLVTLLVSLFIANRIYSRLGIVTAILILPVAYFGGFVLWSTGLTLGSALLVRLAQLAVLNGIAGSAWWALFYVVPADHRGQVFGFDDDLPSQVGVSLSGVLLILGQRVLSDTQILFMGMVVALACGLLVWQMRRAYADTLVEALRAGRYEVFTPTLQSFTPLRGDATALRVVTQAAQDSRPSTRKIAVEVMGRMQDAAAIPHLERATHDADSGVRQAAIESLALMSAPGVAGAIAESLADSNADVRAGAARALAELGEQVDPKTLTILGELVSDPDAHVAAASAAALIRLGEGERGLKRLTALAGDRELEARVIALKAVRMLAETRNRNGDADLLTRLYAVVADRIHDDSAAVRRMACAALGPFPGLEALSPLIGRLDDSDRGVRLAAAAALRRRPDANRPLLSILTKGNEDCQEATLLALTPSSPELFEPLLDFARRQVASAMDWREVAAAIPEVGPVTRLVREGIAERARRAELRLVKALGLLGNPQAMELVARSLSLKEDEGRARAAEALETLGDKRLARVIIPLLEAEPGGAIRTMTPDSALERLLSDPDRWTRALAAQAAAELQASELAAPLREMAESDTDPLPRQAAQAALIRLGVEKAMETLPIVSSLERMILLREVPLFAELSPEDLKQIADVAREQWYPDGEILVEEGDEGTDLFVLASGRVRVSRRVDGSDKLLAERGVGESIGEMAIIESAPRSATVHAAGAVRALVLGADAFKAILHDRPEVSLAVLRVLSRRLRE